MTNLVMDARDREALWELMKPFVQRAAHHIEGAKLASLSSAVALPMSVEVCERIAAEHKAHVDSIVAIKCESQAARLAFVPQYPLVDITGAKP